MEVASKDVMDLIYQYLKDNKLNATLECLMSETNIFPSYFSTKSEQEILISAIRNGLWDVVLQHVQHMNIPKDLMMDLYEHVILEMAEAKENDIAMDILKCSNVGRKLAECENERYRRLEYLVSSSKEHDPKALYLKSSKEKRRKVLASHMEAQVKVAEPSKLLHVMGQALQWQKLRGEEPRLGVVPLGSLEHKVDLQDTMVRKAAGKIKFGKSAIPQCAVFSPDGSCIATGSQDGFIEVWDIDTCQLKPGLAYQLKEEFMMHASRITALAFSMDSEVLLSASSDGKIKAWKIATGKCLLKLSQPHSQAVSCISFNCDDSQILSSSYDKTIRIHGIKSGHLLKEFRGHEDHVNFAIFANKDRILSCSNDGSIKIWDVKSTTCLQNFRPPNSLPGIDLDIISLTLLPNQQQDIQFIACTRSLELFIYNAKGQVLQSFKSTDETKFGDNVACEISKNGKFIYVATEKGFLMCFNIRQKSLENAIQVSKKEIFGMRHHPNRNLLTTYGSDGHVRVWKP